MKYGIHFISGLPRSGSTLLSAILRQNPRFHAGMSSPVSALVGQIQAAMSARNEFHVFIDDAIRQNVIKGIVEGYYTEIGRNKLIFDTGRAWCSKIHVIHRIFPDARVICCVRPLTGILESIERIIRSNPLEPSRMFNFEAGGNVYGRVEQLNAPNGMVGGSLNGLREAFYGDHADKLILVPYDTLAADPENTIARLYRFIGEPHFEHDFENVEYDADEFDLHIGAPGLHRVSGRVEPRVRPSVLPPDLASRYDGLPFWLDPLKNPRKVEVLLPTLATAAEAIAAE